LERERRWRERQPKRPWRAALSQTARR
jgi:hypothetical protein